MQAGDTEASISFTISFSDLEGNAGSDVSATTDASSVIFDETVPGFVSANPPADSGISTTQQITLVHSEELDNTYCVITGDIVDSGYLCGFSPTTYTDDTILVDPDTDWVFGCGMYTLNYDVRDLAGNVFGGSIQYEIMMCK